MRIGVVDVGSNTIRLLVAERRARRFVPIEKGSVRLSLGEEIERRGAVSHESIAAAAKAVRKFWHRRATARASTSLDVFLTAPGRQSANAAELVEALQRAAGVPGSRLSTEEEGRLAYGGAIATADVALPATIAVCDVGGASTEIAVGSPGPTADWVDSVDLGSVRLTARAAAAMHAGGGRGVCRRRCRRRWSSRSRSAAARARRGGSSAPGSARRSSPKRCASSRRLRRAGVARRFDVDRSRARILPAGVAILAEVQQRLGVPLHVCDGGIREGAVLATLAALAALASLRRRDLSHRPPAVEHDGRALRRLRPSSASITSPCVQRDCAVERGEQLERVLRRSALGEPVVGLDLEPERRDRLRAADIGAREHARDVMCEQDVAQSRGLPPAAFVEWPQTVVAAATRRGRRPTHGGAG